MPLLEQLPQLDWLLPQGIIDQRLMERNENWRLCYKALLLLEFMIKHGPMVRRTAGQGVTELQPPAAGVDLMQALSAAVASSCAGLPVLPHG